MSKSSNRRGTSTKCKGVALHQHIRSGSSDRMNVGKSLSTETTRSTTTVHEQGPMTPRTRREEAPRGQTARSFATDSTMRIQNKDRSSRSKQQSTDPASGRRLTLYERSQIRLKEREKKIQSIREEMMRECTFRPNADKTNFRRGNSRTRKKPANGTGTSKTTIRSPTINTPAGKTEATTPTTASSTRQYWQELQRKQIEQQTQQQQQQQQQQVSITSTISRDGSKTISTTKSLRFEELYQDGLRRARQRPATEKVRAREMSTASDAPPLADMLFV